MEIIDKNSSQLKSVLLIISGGISAYKSLELIRLLKKDNINTATILTKGGQQFITELSVGALSGQPVYTDLFSLKDEQEMGHIALSRSADMIVVAPASANMMAKMAHGMADDLASTVLLASNKPIHVFPAMNPEMWENTATQVNIKTLQERGIIVHQPEDGEMACGEVGTGRLPSTEDIFQRIQHAHTKRTKNKKLDGKHALVTAGPTYEPIDPVRFIGNRSSGKQGYAIAESLAKHGAKVTLISGPTHLEPPKGIKVVNVETADEMLKATQDSLPADIAIFSAAVADWSSNKIASDKIKKEPNTNTQELKFKKNVDILKTIAQKNSERPQIIVGFAAETSNLEDNAKQKLTNKNCDILLANGINEKNPVFGSDKNEILCLSKSEDGTIEEESWGQHTKVEIADRLVGKIIRQLDNIGLEHHTDQNIIKLEGTK